MPDAGVMGGPAAPGDDATREFSPRKVDEARCSPRTISAVRSSLLRDEDHEFDSGVDSYDARFGCLTALDVLDNKANDRGRRPRLTPAATTRWPTCSPRSSPTGRWRLPRRRWTTSTGR